MFYQGVKRALPVAIGYLPIAITFGVVAKSAELPSIMIVLMSIMVFAGASQFVAVNLIASGAGILGVIITIFFVNLRHILMSATTSEKLKNQSKGWLALISFGITDESFSIIATDPRDNLPRSYVIGLISIPYLAWVFGTAAGVFIGESLPKLLESSMEIALYAMFVGLLIPEIKRANSKLKVVILAVFISSGLSWLPGFNLSEGWIITVTTLISAIFAAKFIKVEGDRVGK